MSRPKSPLKPWEELTPTHRRRLERAGITKASRETGVSLSKARGHGETPERPQRAQTNTTKYSTYLRRRTPLPVNSTTRGVGPVQDMSKSDRREVGRYWNAVQRHFAGRVDVAAKYAGLTVMMEASDLPSVFTGRPGRRTLADFHGVTVRGVFGDDTEPTDVEFQTDPRTIDGQAFRGELPNNDLYERK